MIADQEVQSEKMSWIYRIFKRTYKITTTKECSTNVSKLKEANIELGITNRAGIFTRKSRRVKMSDNTFQGGEKEKEDNKAQSTPCFTPGKWQASAGYSIVI